LLGETLAFVFFVMSWVTVSWPQPAVMLAWTVRPGVRSSFWCASYSRGGKSGISHRPEGRR
jgi:hypothetical protein